MNILIITPHFYPENFPINQISEELMNKFNISVLTSTPNYPKNKIYKGYKNKFLIEKFKKIKIIRIPIYIKKKYNFLNILLNYISFVYFFFLYKKKILVSLNKIDCILSYGISPITSLLPGLVLKKKFNCKLILWLQDLWPESVQATGFIKNSFIIFILRKICNYIYKKHSVILVQSNGFKKILKKRKIETRTKIFFNCYNFPRIKKLPKKKYQKILYYLNNFFCITYTGNIGKAQNFNTLLKASKQINNKKIIFLIIGEGNQKLKIKNFIKEHKINNIKIFNQVEKQYIYDIQNKSQALFMTLKNQKIFENTIPSKLQQYLSIGKPILGEVNGEAKKIIIKSKAGLVFKQGSYNSFKKQINNLFNINKNNRNKMGKNAKSFFSRNYLLKTKISNLIYEIQN